MDVPSSDVSTVIAANTTCSWHRVNYEQVDPKLIQPYLAYRPIRIVKLTLSRTTQMARMTISQPLRKHLKSRFDEVFHVRRLEEAVSTDPIFANCRSLFHGFLGAQVFLGMYTSCIDVGGFKGKGEFPQLYRDFIQENGAPSIL
jgi:hypothetical protein